MSRISKALVVAILFTSSPTVSMALEPSTEQKPADVPKENLARVVLSFTSRYASNSLSVALVELAAMARDKRYSAVLTMPIEQAKKLSSANKACFDQARHDPSGRMFDIARCAKIWPEAGKVNEPKELEAAFAAEVAKQGVAGKV